MLRKWKLYKNGLWKPSTIEDINIIKLITKFENLELHESKFYNHIIAGFNSDHKCIFTYNTNNKIIYIQIIDKKIYTDDIKEILNFFYDLKIKDYQHDDLSYILRENYYD